MKCGYCNGEMLAGYIPAPAVEWIPENKEPRVVYHGEKKDGFRLGRHQFFDMKRQKSWYCPECDVIVIDCKQEKE